MKCMLILEILYERKLLEAKLRPCTYGSKIATLSFLSHKQIQNKITFLYNKKLKSLVIFLSG